MTFFEAFILGAVQAITEFLPISSSGHLIVLPYFFDWQAQALVFDVILHLATALAIITYFRHDLWNVFLGLIADFQDKKLNLNEYSKDGKLGLYIILGTIPAAVIGFLLEGYLATTFRSVASVVVFLCAGSLLMFLAELYAFKTKGNPQHGELDAKKSLIIGFFQSLALFSGVSRSGSTISGGMLLNLSRENAARFSFLLSIPIVLGASAVSILTSFDAELLRVGWGPIVVGFVSSLVFGLLSIKYLLKFLRTNTLYVFIFYRLILAAFLLWFIL